MTVAEFEIITVLKIHITIVIKTNIINKHYRGSYCILFEEGGFGGSTHIHLSQVYNMDTD